MLIVSTVEPRSKQRQSYQPIIEKNTKSIMKLSQSNISQLCEYITGSEEFLLEKTVQFAREQGYLKYTATSKEAWRIAIAGLSEALVKGLQTLYPNFELPVLADYSRDPIAAFAVLEAQRHRSRGVSLDMFLGLMKYFREAYFELVRAQNHNNTHRDQCTGVIQRLFDRIEIAFCMEWAKSEKSEVVKELQRRNRSMADEKGRYVTIFESHPLPVFILDKECKVIAFNLTAKSFLESAGHADCTSLYDMNKTALDGSGNLEQGDSIPQDREKTDIGSVFPWLIDDLKTFILSNDVTISIDRETLIQKIRKHFRIIFSRILDISEKLSGVIITLEDVTERLQIAEELHRARKLESLGQLSAGIAHEINTPIQYIGTNTQFLKEGFKDIMVILGSYEQLLAAAKENKVSTDLVHTTVQAIDEADVDFLREEIPNAILQSIEGIGRVTQIVRSMKDFSHPGNKEKSDTNLNRCIESAITVSRNEWKLVANIESDFDRDLPMVPCYRGEVNQVLLNLITNATHAISDKVGDGAKDKGTITVTTRRNGNWAKVCVADNGSGIPEDIRDKIFDPFFTTKQVGKGTGQGLSIAHSVIVDQHGGTIALESEVGKGTTFTIRLPLVSTA